MNVQIRGETVRVSGVRNLDCEHAADLRNELEYALRRSCQRVDIDLSQTRSVDSAGLGVLLGAWMACGRVRLLNVPAVVRQLLDLTRQRHKFELAQV